MTKILSLSAIAVFLSLSTIGPAEAGPRTEGAVKGALVGAAVGSLVGGSDGAKTGAAVGAITGNLSNAK